LGYVATNLSLHALTGEGTAHNQMDTTTATGMSPENAAYYILNAAAQQQHTAVICALKLRVGYWLSLFAPPLFHWIMQKRARKDMNLNRSHA
jgi:dehydrogenase/reductase SDR family protein 7B